MKRRMIMKHSAAVALWGLAILQRVRANSNLEFRNANHIFNAIHSSMRQWGSSLNHNGMTAWIATVPSGIELYHGTDSPDRVNNTQWLAFEPEHALIFARPHGPPLGHLPPPPENLELVPRELISPSPFASHGRLSPGHHVRYPLEPRTASTTERLPLSPFYYNDRPLRSPVQREEQLRLNHGKHTLYQEHIRSDHGYLHIYITKKNLRLLYLDGQSAAKSDKGTLDMQDIVILNLNSTRGLDSDEPPHGPMFESERAAGLCRIAQDYWAHRIDGFVRMEGGFEMILCSFKDNLNLLQILETKPEAPAKRPGLPPIGSSPADLHYYKAVAARYDGIGGNRVELEYDNLISLFAYPDALYFDDTGRPRALKGSKVLEKVRSDLKKVALSVAEANPTDWQAVADMVVGRYENRLQLLASGRLKSVDAMQDEIEAALRPFIDYGKRNISEEIARCKNQFIPARVVEG